MINLEKKSIVDNYISLENAYTKRLQTTFSIAQELLAKMNRSVIQNGYMDVYTKWFQEYEIVLKDGQRKHFDGTPQKALGNFSITTNFIQNELMKYKGDVFTNLVELNFQCNTDKHDDKEIHYSLQKFKDEYNAYLNALASLTENKSYTRFLLGQSIDQEIVIDDLTAYLKERVDGSLLLSFNRADVARAIKEKCRLIVRILDTATGEEIMSHVKREISDFDDMVIDVKGIAHKRGISSSWLTISFTLQQMQTTVVSDSEEHYGFLWLKVRTIPGYKEHNLVDIATVDVNIDFSENDEECW